MVLQPRAQPALASEKIIAAELATAETKKPGQYGALSGFGRQLTLEFVKQFEGPPALRLMLGYEVGCY